MLVTSVLVGMLVGATMAWRTPVATAGAPTGAPADVLDPVPGVPPELVQRLGRVAVRIEASRCDGPVQGSGVLLDNGSVVTNRHVLEAASGARMVGTDGSTRPLQEYTTQTLEDLAVATVAPSPGSTPDGADERPDGDGQDPLPAPVEPGDTVVVAGYPGGAPLSVTAGSVSSWVDGADYSLGPDPVLLTDVTVIGGSSGSGVFDLDGRLVGIVAARDLATGGAVVIPAARLELPQHSGAIGWTLC